MSLNGKQGHPSGNVISQVSRGEAKGIHSTPVTFTDRGGLNTVYRGALNPSPGRVTPGVIGGSPKQARPSRVPTLGRVSIRAYQ